MLNNLIYFFIFYFLFLFFEFNLILSFLNIIFNDYALNLKHLPRKHPLMNLGNLINFVYFPKWLLSL